MMNKKTLKALASLFLAIGMSVSGIPVYANEDDTQGTNNTPAEGTNGQEGNGQDPVSVQEPTGIEIVGNADLTVKENESVELQYSLYPENSSNENVIWEVVSGEEYISFEQVTKTVFGIQEGSAVVKASLNNDSFIQYNITIC